MRVVAIQGARAIEATAVPLMMVQPLRSSHDIERPHISAIWYMLGDIEMKHTHRVSTSFASRIRRETFSAR
jgi:hypothetical protein